MAPNEVLLLCGLILLSSIIESTMCTTGQQVQSTLWELLSSHFTDHPGP